MVTLAVGNSYSQLTGMTQRQEKEVRNLLSYAVDANASYFSGYRGPKRRCLMDKKGSFPTGLLHRLPDLGATVVENRFKPISQPQGFILHGEPYLWQVDAVRLATEAHRGTISAPTGTGKSMAMALLISRLNVRTLVIVPTTELKKQLSETLRKFKNVTVMNVDSPTLRKPSDYDCLIIDEAHHVAARTYQKLNKTAWAGIYYRFFFTATPFRNNADETMLFEAIAGKLIYKLDYYTAIRQGYIVPVEAYYVDVPRQVTDAYTYAEVYQSLVVRNDARNNALYALLLRLGEAGLSTLCLVKEIAHGAILERLTGIPFVSGLSSDTSRLIDDFNTGKIKSLIGTTGILGEGIDTRPAEFVVIAGLGKAKSQFMQQVGRALRKYPGKESAKVILIRDASHKFTLRHFKAQAKIMREEYGVKPERISI